MKNALLIFILAHLVSCHGQDKSKSRLYGEWHGVHKIKIYENDTLVDFKTQSYLGENKQIFIFKEKSVLVSYFGHDYEELNYSVRSDTLILNGSKLLITELSNDQLELVRKFSDGEINVMKFRKR